MSEYDVFALARGRRVWLRQSRLSGRGCAHWSSIRAACVIRFSTIRSTWCSLLRPNCWRSVICVEGSDGNFTVFAKAENGATSKYHSRKIVVATGYYDLPNKLNVPGEDLPHVSHYYTEPHSFWKENVVVVGGKNSAAEAALDLYRNGAKVTLVHRDAHLGQTIKYWVKPDIENRIKAGQIQALFETQVKEITPHEIVVSNAAGEKRLPAKQVFALTGYHPDFSFIQSLGVHLDPVTCKPSLDPNTLESNIPGIYLGGVVIGGRHTGEIFIENGRFHGKQIIQALGSQRTSTQSA